MKESGEIGQLRLDLWLDAYGGDEQHRQRLIADAVKDRWKPGRRYDVILGRSVAKDLGEAFEEELRFRLWVARREATAAAIRGTQETWRSIRLKVLERDGPFCDVCGVRVGVKSGDYWCGHIVDRCVGGSDRPSNLVVQCWFCNYYKPVHHNREEYERWKRSLYDGAREVT